MPQVRSENLLSYQENIPCVQCSKLTISIKKKIMLIILTSKSCLQFITGYLEQCPLLLGVSSVILVVLSMFFLSSLS